MGGQTAITAISLIVASLLAGVFYARVLHPLAGFPGPFWASLSNAWAVRQCRGGNFEQVQRRLHARYGPLVRIAPNELCCSDPEAIRILYRTKQPLDKSASYTVWTNKTLKYPDHFSNTDSRQHQQRRAIVNNAYSMTSVLSMEDRTNECFELFAQRLDRHAEQGQQPDLGDWLIWFTFNMLGVLFFGKMFGFMEHAHDHEDWIKSLDACWPFISTLQTAGYLRYLILPFAIMDRTTRDGLAGHARLLKSGRFHVEQRLSMAEDMQDQQRDILQSLLKIAKSRSAEGDFQIPEIKSESVVALIAGADTTAIALRSVFYHLMRNPETYSELLREISDACSANKVSEPIPRYNEAAQLPLLVATFKEASRLHPSVGFTLPRVIPPGGLDIAGTFVPGGVDVGVNAAVVGFDKTVFGDDADEFRPRRWLDDKARAIEMEKHWLQFGAGPRTCLGKNISLFEIYKVISFIVKRYHIELADPAKKWTTSNFWFFNQKGLVVKIRRL